MNYRRTLLAPKRPFFLFGPRGTGKSTWLKTKFPQAYAIDLLRNNDFYKYAKDPALFEKEIKALKRGSWILIDEIQKLPRLLDEAQNLIENHGFSKVAMSGSSARKLRRESGNLLAGRAILKNLFPLTAKETNYEIAIDQFVTYGALPACVTMKKADREDFLTSYVETYLREEIRAEGLVRNLDSFARFLEVASLAAGQVTNLQQIASDCGVNRNSVRGFFSILEDTLIGYWLPAYRPRAKIKEVAHPKFYWFDAGVLRAAADGFNRPLPAEFEGVAFETFILNELRAHIHYNSVRGKLSYWRTPSGSEVDFVFESPKGVIAIEVKGSRSYKSHFAKGIKSLSENLQLKSKYLIYRGDKSLIDGDVHVIPALDFIKLLNANKIL